VGWFARAAAATGNAMGTSRAFFVATLVVVVWAITGPLFHYSDTWQLVINTGTSVATFLMVFLIQNMQNRDAKALHVKLDELLRAVHEARNEIISVEEETDEQLEELQQQFREVRQPGTGVPQPPRPSAPPDGSASATSIGSPAAPALPIKPASAA
jgi:low affinity Fe/Cu permease